MVHRSRLSSYKLKHHLFDNLILRLCCSYTQNIFLQFSRSPSTTLVWRLVYSFLHFFIVSLSFISNGNPLKSTPADFSGFVLVGTDFSLAFCLFIYPFDPVIHLYLYFYLFSGLVLVGTDPSKLCPKQTVL